MKKNADKFNKELDSLITKDSAVRAKSSPKTLLQRMMEEKYNRSETLLSKLMENNKRKNVKETLGNVRKSFAKE